MIESAKPLAQLNAVRRFSGGFTHMVQSPMLTIAVGLASMTA
jgi:hypothetical protein